MATIGVLRFSVRLTSVAALFDLGGDFYDCCIFGHSGFSEEEKYKQRLLDLFDEQLSGEQVDFYLGYYGRFNRFAYSCAKKYKEKHPNANLILVTPYFNETTHSVLKPDYDMILYPELESVPLKYRIIKRNEWTARAADLIITYVTHSFGGAYKAYSYAKKEGKENHQSLRTIKTGPLGIPSTEEGVKSVLFFHSFTV